MLASPSSLLRKIRPPHVHGALSELTLTCIKQFRRPVLRRDLRDASGQSVVTLAVGSQLFAIRGVSKAAIGGRL